MFGYFASRAHPIRMNLMELEKLDALNFDPFQKVRHEQAEEPIDIIMENLFDVQKDTLKSII